MSKYVQLAIPVMYLTVISLVSAGPLTPPPGPITSTHKTLTEIEPRTAINAANTPGDADSSFRITQPGSYYLTANIFASAGKHGIEIASDNITIDLNGFGVLSTGIGLDGISTAGIDRNNITIRNGVVAFWAQDGIDLRGNGARIEQVTARSNSARGIAVDDESSITDCLCISNLTDGFTMGSASVITRSTASQNVRNGIDALTSCIVENCIAYNNGNIGIRTLIAGAITNSSARLNGSIGIVASSGSNVLNCTANENEGSGFLLSACSIANSTAGFNGKSGYESNGNVRIVSCTANSNGESGMQLANTTFVTECSLTGSPTIAHININGDNNTIDSCTIIGGSVGILISTAGERNTIIRNICNSVTTPWNISEDNYYGQIIDRRIPETVASTPAANGFSAASTLGSTSPFANFTY